MSRSTDKVAFLVVCWNNQDIIEGCLDSIAKQAYSATVTYVIDNASADNTVQVIKSSHPEVILTTSKENTGFARGNNILIRQALEDPDVKYVALINSDATLEENWTAHIVDYIHDKHRVACAQGLTLDYYNHSIVDSEHVYFGDNFQSVQYGYGEPLRSDRVSPRKIFGVNAAAALYSRAYIENQKDRTLFDEKFFMYLEDVDICFRAIMTGWNNYTVPSAVAYHMGSVSAKKRPGSYNLYMTFRNQTALLMKNMPVRTFFHFLPRAVLFELHFYRHLKRTQGVDARNLAIKGRIVGLCRAVLYVPDRLRLKRKWQLDHAQLEHVMTHKGIY